MEAAAEAKATAGRWRPGGRAGARPGALRWRAGRALLAGLLAVLLAPAGQGAALAREGEGETERLAAAAEALRTETDARHRELELLAEEVAAARTRGARLLAGAGELDARDRAARREHDRARRDAARMTLGMLRAGPDPWLAAVTGRQERLPRETRWLMRDHQAALRDARDRMARAEATMATVEVEREGLGGSLVEQALEAERLHELELQAETLATDLERDLRGVDRRVADLVEADRAREEAAAREAFAAWSASAGPPAQDGPAPRGAVAKAVQIAMAQRGTPYQWGAEGPDRFDCSGLMQFAYAAAGVQIPRVSRDQFAAFAKRRPIAMKVLRAGDLVFFADRPADPGTIHHVGMYVGDGLMVEAPYTGAVVRTSSIMRGSYAGAVRPVP